ncbi:MAG: Transcriptional regulator, MerR family, partial [Klenkia sp.]|nr:Transcriptional regulator, MerR family [Klenkia sp.]
MTHLSIRTLRRHHDAGLLQPELRAPDLPLDDVRAVSTSPDPAVRASRVAGHLDRRQDRLARTRAAVASMQRLLDPDRWTSNCARCRRRRSPRSPRTSTWRTEIARPVFRVSPGWDTPGART